MLQVASATLRPAAAAATRSSARTARLAASSTGASASSSAAAAAPSRRHRRAFHSSRPAHSAGTASLADTLHTVVPAIQSLPPLLAPYLPGPLAAYPITTSLILITCTLRTAVTLPAALWQRARSRRMAEDVYPIWEQMKKQLPLQVRDRCRRAGKSYDEFRTELEAEMKKSLRDLLRKHRCTPLPTMLVPLAVQIPLFITLSYLIREACLSPEFAQELLPWSTWSFTGPTLAQQQQLDAFAQSASILRDRGMNEEMLAQLMGPRGGGASGGGIGSTLAQKDSSMQGPIALGMITLLNAELSAYRTTRERKHLESDPAADVGGATAGSAGASKMRTAAAAAAAAPSPPSAAAGAASRDYRARSSSAPSPAPRRPPPRSQRSPSFSSSASASASASPAQAPAGGEPQQEVRKASLRTAIFTNTLRAAAIAFVPIASQVPGGLLIYWLTSATYTLGQNAILDWREQRWQRERPARSGHR
ncbi:hypothetical protein OC835_001150 [Tilletia horrida]|nr:hypothetical protein OC835_001150 [Tilletia horrida]